ncbi:MAG: class I SAM-dependent methyltransferase [Betaproteobacteria bacterium]|nr:class I SAM-dependent methyltransferase [Betaproteobacteria bacterium]
MKFCAFDTAGEDVPLPAIDPVPYDSALSDRVLAGRTMSLLRGNGLGRGMRVADIGCGTGASTLRLAAEVGASGMVVGVDDQEMRLQAGRNAAVKAGLDNLWFAAASAYDTGLPRASFQFVYARCLLSRLARPWDALEELVQLLEPGGTLVWDELGTVPSGPVTLPGRVRIDAARCDALGPESDVGTRLSRALRASGLAHVGVSHSDVPAGRGDGSGFGLRWPRRVALWQVWGSRRHPAV